MFSFVPLTLPSRNNNFNARTRVKKWSKLGFKSYLSFEKLLSGNATKLKAQKTKMQVKLSHLHSGWAGSQWNKTITSALNFTKSWYILVTWFVCIRFACLIYSNAKCCDVSSIMTKLKILVCSLQLPCWGQGCASALCTLSNKDNSIFWKYRGLDMEAVLLI